MIIQEFFDRKTFTLTYVVRDAETGDAVVIDPVRDYDFTGSVLSEESWTEVREYLNRHQLRLRMVLETHAHADHVTAAPLAKRDFPGVAVVIGAGITTVQKTFKEVFQLGEDFAVDGSQFDRLVHDGEEFQAGSIPIRALATPGHTPACMSWLIGDHLFTGDSLFMPDYGTGRCDFPRGDAAAMYDSIHEKLYNLDDSIQVYTGHDYLPEGRDLRFRSSIGESKARNIQLTGETTREEYVQERQKRDATLAPPALLYPSIYLNINAGNFHGGDEGFYLKMPVRIA